MKTRHHQRGVSIAMVVVILVVLATAFVASYGLTRLGDANTGRDETVTKLKRAVEALDQFAAANHRLPCPAVPTLMPETGLEALTAVGGSSCVAAAEEGTLPWQTLGLRKEDAYDSWGLKISYRVYLGNKGPLVQPEGVNMTECDTDEPTTGATTAAGLCVSNANPFLRSTSATKFLSGKELSLTENGVARSNVAYVVLSHGPTGLGAYTVAGTQREMPAGDERNNTRAAGPFTIKAFSDVNEAATSGQHFDDLVAYRTLPDLVKKVGLAARDWTDEVVGTSQFTASVVAAAPENTTGTTSGDLNLQSLTAGSVKVTSSTGGTLALGSVTQTDGTTAEGLGVAGNGSNQLSSLGGEHITAVLQKDAGKLAIALASFGTYDFFGVTYTEQLQLRFIDKNNATVDTKIVSGCRNEASGITSYSITPTGVFRSVEIKPLNATSPYFAGYTFLLVSELSACTASATACTTTLGAPCP